MRTRLLAALTALALPMLPAVAGPLDPPPRDELRAWVIEWAGGSKPAVQNGEITFTVKRGRAVLALIEFEARGKHRDLFGGYFTNLAGSTEGHWYPAVWADGHGDLVPACQYSVTCSDPFAPLPRDPETRRLSGNIPGKRSIYVVAQNTEVHKITASPGWKKPREVKTGFAVRLVRKIGAGVRVNSTGVEHFTGASAPGGRYGSVALAVLPCFPNGGVGSAVLRGGDPSPDQPKDGTRKTRCDGITVAESAANRATTWRFEGEATGDTAIPDRLVVVDLPRYP